MRDAPTLSAPDRALMFLRQMINGGRMARGSRLPPERELALRCGVGRSALRKALARLEAEGVVWRHVGRGTFLGGPPDPATNQFSSLSSAGPKDVMEARLMFEPVIAAAAARSATSSDIAEMRRCVEKIDAVADWDEFDLWDLRLHRSIAASTRNPLAILILDAINEFRQHDDWGRQQLPPVRSRLHQESTAQHHSVVEAIAARDPRAAAEAMRQHLIIVRALYFDRAHEGVDEETTPLQQPSAARGVTASSK